MLSRLIARGVTLVLVAGILLTGCSDSEDIGVRRVGGGKIEFVFPVCRDEKVNRVTVADVTSLAKIGDGEILWEIRAVDEGRYLDVVGLGDQPEGFEVRAAAAIGTVASSRTLRVLADSNRSKAMVTVFVPGDLPADGQVVAGDKRYTTVNDARLALTKSCSGSSARDSTWVAAAVFGTVGLAIAALVRVTTRQSRRAAKQRISSPAAE